MEGRLSIAFVFLNYMIFSFKMFPNTQLLHFRHQSTEKGYLQICISFSIGDIGLSSHKTVYWHIIVSLS